MNRHNAINLDSDDEIIQTSPNKSKGKAQECIDLTLDDTDEEQEVQSKQQERTAMPSTTPSVSASPDRDLTLKQQSSSTSRILSPDLRARKSTVEDDKRVEQQMISDSQPEEDQKEEENLGDDEQDDPYARQNKRHKFNHAEPEREASIELSVSPPPQYENLNRNAVPSPSSTPATSLSKTSRSNTSPTDTKAELSLSLSTQVSDFKRSKTTLPSTSVTPSIMASESSDDEIQIGQRQSKRFKSKRDPIAEEMLYNQKLNGKLNTSKRSNFSAASSSRVRLPSTASTSSKRTIDGTSKTTTAGRGRGKGKGKAKPKERMTKNRGIKAVVIIDHSLPPSPEMVERYVKLTKDCLRCGLPLITFSHFSGQSGASATPSEIVPVQKGDRQLETMSDEFTFGKNVTVYDPKFIEETKVCQGCYWYDADGNLKNSLILQWQGRRTEINESLEKCGLNGEEKHQCHNPTIGNAVKNQKIRNCMMDLRKDVHAAKGWTLHSLDKIAGGGFIGIYTGEVITAETAKERMKTGWNSEYQFDLSKFESDDCSLVVDALEIGNPTRFMNHSCDPNVATITSYIPSKSGGLISYVSFFAVRKIKVGDELQISYRSCRGDGTKGKNKQQIEAENVCLCDTIYCDGYVRWELWVDPTSSEEEDDSDDEEE